MRPWFCLIAVFAVALCAGCHKESAHSIPVDAKLASFVPPDTSLLAGIDLDGLKASPFYRRHESELNVPQLNALPERLGLDPRRDVSAVLIAWQGNQPLVMAHGSFSAKEVEPNLAAAGGQSTHYRDQNLFGGGDDAVFFPSQNILIAGPVSALHSLIDRGSGGGIPAPVQTRLGNLPPDDQIWAVSTQGLPVDRIPMRSDVSSAFSNLVRYVAGVNVGIGIDDGIHLQADLTCLSADGARQVHDALRGGIGMGRLMTKDDELDLLKLYDSIKVDQDQQAVRVHADLPAELSDRLLKYLPGLTGRADRMLMR